MTRHLPPYLKPRRQPDGSYRPRWEPGPGLRAKGFSGEDLKDEAGQWLGLEAAIQRAEALNAEVKGATPKRRRKSTAETRSCRALAEDWQRSVRWVQLAPSTQADYRVKLRPFLDVFGEAHVKAVTAAQVEKFWEGLYHGRGHHMANGVVRVVGALMRHAERREWRDKHTNPANDLQLPAPPGRLVLWTPEEIDAVIAAGDALGLPSIGDAVMLGLHSGQREGDVLALPEAILADEALKLSQSKTKARVDVPMTPALLKRMTEARLRKRARGIWREAAIVVSETTGRAYKAYHFRHVFADVRKEAEKACGSVTGKHFQDFRDTAVTRLALAGCDLIRICAVTGHSAASVQMIMKHYLALDSRMAREAIDKLNDWMQREGVAL